MYHIVFNFLQLCAKLGLSDWLMVLLNRREGLRSVSMRPGALSVMTIGMLLTQVLSVCNLDTHLQVSLLIIVAI